MHQVHGGAAVVTYIVFTNDAGRLAVKPLETDEPVPDGVLTIER